MRLVFLNRRPRCPKRWPQDPSRCGLFESDAVLVGYNEERFIELLAKHGVPMMDPLLLCAGIESGDPYIFRDEE